MKTVYVVMRHSKWERGWKVEMMIEEKKEALEKFLNHKWHFPFCQWRLCKAELEVIEE